MCKLSSVVLLLILLLFGPFIPPALRQREKAPLSFWYAVRYLETVTKDRHCCRGGGAVARKDTSTAVAGVFKESIHPTNTV